jgi:hypothetical protein
MINNGDVVRLVMVVKARFMMEIKRYYQELQYYKITVVLEVWVSTYYAYLVSYLYPPIQLDYILAVSRKIHLIRSLPLAPTASASVAVDFFVLDHWVLHFCCRFGYAAAQFRTTNFHSFLENPSHISTETQHTISS